jgi:hypothetical protein
MGWPLAVSAGLIERSSRALVMALWPLTVGHLLAMFLVILPFALMIAAGGLLEWLVYRYLGLKFVSRSWFNLDATWAFSLVLVGVLSLAISLASRH